MFLETLACYGLFTPSSGHLDENVLIQCPFHQDDRPSCSINIRADVFFCHGCHEHGTLLRFVSLLEAKRLHLDELNEWLGLVALAKIKRQAPVDPLPEFLVPQIRLQRKETERAARIRAYDFYTSLPIPQWNMIKYHYLQDRGFSDSTLRLFGIRLNPSSHYQIVIPVSQQNRFRGYIARRNCDVENSIKYVNNPGFSKSTTVGGSLRKGPVLIVEGWFDMMMARQNGFRNTACLFGWHCSDTQAEFLRLYATEIISGLDNDARGHEGTRRLQTLFPHLPFRRLPFPHDVKDVCEMDPAQFTASIYFT